MSKKSLQFQPGFTLIEIIVATAIFVMVVTGMLAMLNNTLKINRRVQSTRQLVQGTRAFTETLAREIRNGRVDYSDYFRECSAANYENPQQSLGLIARNGDRLCFYLDQGTLMLKKHTASGDTQGAVFDAEKFRLNTDSFKFIVQPTQNPSNGGSGVQPFVTIVAQLEFIDPRDVENASLNYQTTISTDVYDIPHI